MKGFIGTPAGLVTRHPITIAWRHREPGEQYSDGAILLIANGGTEEAYTLELTPLVKAYRVAELLRNSINLVDRRSGEWGARIVGEIIDRGSDETEAGLLIVTARSAINADSIPEPVIQLKFWDLNEPGNSVRFEFTRARTEQCIRLFEHIAGALKHGYDPDATPDGWPEELADALI
jgi:hypothetical protein